jgi:hypothetical protein
MSQSAVLTKPVAQVPFYDVIAPSLEQVICIHPHAETTDHIYEFTATVASNDTLQWYKVLVLVANPCLAAINRAVRDTLGDRWFATQWHQSVVR